MVEENKDRKIQQLEEDISLLEIYVKDFRELFSFIPFPICFANPQGIALEVNPSFLEITGYGEIDIIGEKIFNLFDEDEKNNLQRTIKEKAVKNWETLIKTKDGEEVPISAFIRKNETGHGSPVGGIFFSFFDLREVNEKERKLEQKITEIKKINRLMEGRELKMVELKKKIKELEKELERYQGVDSEVGPKDI